MTSPLFRPLELGPLHLPTVDGTRSLTLAGLHGSKVLLIEFASW